MKQFGGPAAFIDRNDINTDEIIPAKYLTEITRQALLHLCIPAPEIERQTEEMRRHLLLPGLALGAEPPNPRAMIGSS